MSNQNVKDSLVKVGHGIVKVGSKTKDVALESKDKKFVISIIELEK